MARVQGTRTRKAKDAPVIASGIVDSRELEVAPEKTVHFEQEGRKEYGEDIQIENNLDNINEKARRLSFMEELVTIHISEGTEKDAEKYVFLSVNGVGAGPGGIPWVPRGQDVTIKRKYLNVLANARHVRYKNHEYVDNNGVKQSAQKAYSADRYPFQVIEDTSMGREWLKQLRATRRAG